MASGNWHSVSLEELENELRTNLREGLGGDESKSRLVSFGANELPLGNRDSLALIFLRQFESPLIYILLGAGLLVFLTGEKGDAFIIVFVTLFNAVVGTFQEGKAQNTLDALKKFSEGSATVLRGNEELIVPDRELVPGDVIIVREGEKIPADARLIETHNLKVDESAITGEAIPVHKAEGVIHNKERTPSQQTNMVFKGTYAVAGRARAIVVATGGNSWIGGVSRAISRVDTEIPLKADIRHLSQVILSGVFAVISVVFSLGLFYGKPAEEMFRTAVALAVSIIPEGLPIVITLILATGVWRMAKRNALVKKLQAVEALGQARVIAVDKTGTITVNELVVRKVFAGEKMFEVTGYGYEGKGDVLFNGNTIDPLNHEELLLAGKIAAFCSDAEVAFLEGARTWKVAGDPTEAAMLVFSEKIGFHRSELDQEAPVLSDLPFDYKTRYHATSHRVDDGSVRQFIAIAGAPEAVLALSTKWIAEEGKLKILGDEERKELEKTFSQMAHGGLRVVGFGFLEVPFSEGKMPEIKNMTLAGFFGIEDSIRPEVHASLLRAKEAGVKVVMISGDHKNTAVAIAREAGIYSSGDTVLTGEELSKLSETEFLRALGTTTVFARIEPDDKMKIIFGYRKRGEVVAMTGDGVNDAPSLVAADLGVAMGRIGTEVAKEAADIVLLDDNFGSIVSAIEEGRSIYKTIKKVILYLFSTGLGEVFTIVGALFLGFPLPILPGQIVWLNLVTDGFLDVALAMEPKEQGLLAGKFERPKKYLVDKLMMQRMPGMALVMMAGALAVFMNYAEYDMPKALTLSLTTLAIFQWFNAWNCRSETKSIFSSGIFSNKFLIYATVVVVFLQLFAVYSPIMNQLLKTTPLGLADWILAAVVAFSIVVVEEVRKFFYRRFLHSRPGFAA